MSLRRSITRPGAITALLVLQIVALILFPPESFATTSQEWWLPTLLMIMVVIADVQLIARRSAQSAPWYLISFANGFNIISRLMMLFPHATIPTNGAYLFNAPYVILTAISMAVSYFMLTYTEWPEVRMGLLRNVTSSVAKS